MELQEQILHATVREGYQILLRADAVLLLPQAYGRIAEYYCTLADKCMVWAKDVQGELLRRRFSELQTVHERSHFLTQWYRFAMKVVFEDETHAAILCESTLTGQEGKYAKSYHRLSHVWRLSEESILPLPQVTETFLHTRRARGIPFRPDGIYPQGKELVFFRNPRAESAFAEVRQALPGA